MIQYENYPKDGDPEKYPNYDIIEEVITEERVSQFKKAVECGNKSASGRGIPFSQASLLTLSGIMLSTHILSQTNCNLRFGIFTFRCFVL